MGQCLGKELEVGDRRVVVKKKLGEGAFSDVLLAADTVSGAKYAMKVIVCSEDRDFAVAEREAKVYGLFNHENLVRCVGWSADARTVRMLFPLADSGTVQDMIDQSPGGISPPTAASLFHGMCAGLQAMHSHAPPYAHRDIKPANILLYGATPVLTDFGSASEAVLDVPSRKEALALQEYAAEFSTLPFRAPELFEVQAGWNEHNTLTAADVWAMGATLYTMLVGETPFEKAAGPQGSLTLAIAQGKYPPPPTEVPPSLVDLVASALQVDVRDRPTMEQLLAAADGARSPEVAVI